MIPYRKWIQVEANTSNSRFYEISRLALLWWLDQLIRLVDMLAIMLDMKERKEYSLSGNF